LEKVRDVPESKKGVQEEKGGGAARQGRQEKIISKEMSEIERQKMDATTAEGDAGNGREVDRSTGLQKTEAGTGVPPLATSWQHAIRSHERDRLGLMGPLEKETFERKGRGDVGESRRVKLEPVGRCRDGK